MKSFWVRIHINLNNDSIHVINFGNDTYRNIKERNKKYLTYPYILINLKGGKNERNSLNGWLVSLGFNDSKRTEIRRTLREGFIKELKTKRKGSTNG